ncbi:MAG: UDP-N-acetylenolpyruvoylglucosamine reductase, partial [Catalinimonas sp.]
IKEVFDELEAVRLDDGRRRTFDAATCRFGYRNSVFKNELRGQYVIATVTMRLRREPLHNVSYGAIRTTLAEMGVTEPTVRAISDAVIRIRQSKLPDPAQIGNAGSFFKNPELDPDDFARLQLDHPEIPNYPTDSHKIKVPAGWLIEQAGWKGHRVGNVGVHDRQALVLVNLGGARGAEVRALAERIQVSVREQFGVDLQAEVNFV